jgi:threonine/homoserine/homoserine lactone efflux protein
VSALLGFGYGLLFAMPVGPVGALCVRRSMTAGLLAGAGIGAGAALADAACAAAAAELATGVRPLLAAAGPAMRSLAAAVLVLMGMAMALRARRQVLPSKPGGTLAGAGLAFALTVTNPITLAAFAAVWAARSPGLGRGDLLPLTAGVFAGSQSWWTLLATASDRLGPTLRRHLPTVDRLAGSIIALSGVALLVSLAR